MNYPLCELIVDGRGGVSDPSDALDPFDHVAQLEDFLGAPLRAIEITTTVTTVTTTTTRRVITMHKEQPM